MYLRLESSYLLQLTDAFYKAVRTGEWKEAAINFKKELAKFEEELGKRSSPFFGGNVCKRWLCL